MGFFKFPGQLWKKSEDGKLKNKLRCWDGTYCKTNYTSLPQDGMAGFIEFDKVLAVDSGTLDVSFQKMKSSKSDEQQWLWTDEVEGNGWQRIKNKQTDTYLTAELQDGKAKLIVKERGIYRYIIIWYRSRLFHLYMMDKFVSNLGKNIIK